MWGRKTSVIMLPKDENLRKQFELKLKACKNLFNSCAPPKPQMFIICVSAILKRLLRDGQVKTWDISIEIDNEYPGSYDSDAFNSACLVIEDCCAEAISKRPRIGYPPPIGRKVRLLNDFQVTARAPLETFAINATGVTKSVSTMTRIVNITIPIETIGIVVSSGHSMRALDYNKECLVQFDNPMIPRTVIIPWDILEYAD